MKRPLFPTCGAIFAALLCSTLPVGAQPLTITPSDTQCSAAGGELTLRVAFAYPDAAPAALGLQLVLPPGWAHVSTGGPNLPSIAPSPGDTGSLGWAYVEVPSRSAEFRVALRYPASLTTEQVLRAMAIWRPAPPEAPRELSIMFAAP